MLKTISIEGLDTPVILARRKGTRNLRLSIKNDGSIRLSVPYGIPEFMAKRFAAERLAWIQKHQKPRIIILEGAHIGKNHRLVIEQTTATQIRSRVTATEIKIMLPPGASVEDAEVQTRIKRACDKALLAEATALLPQRLAHISKLHALPYRSCTAKKLKSRWGACDNYGNITLNHYLIQLDWPLIDYVLCHELAHTVHHHHQPTFWQLVEKLCPDYKARRKLLKTKPTDIIPTTF